MRKATKLAKVLDENIFEAAEKGKKKRLYLGVLKELPDFQDRYREVEAKGYKRKLFYMCKQGHKLVNESKISFGEVKGDWGIVKAFGVFWSPRRNAHLVAWTPFNSGVLRVLRNYSCWVIKGSLEITP